MEKINFESGRRYDLTIFLFIIVIIGLSILCLSVLSFRKKPTVREMRRVRAIEYGQEKYDNVYDKTVLTSYEEYETFLIKENLETKIGEEEFEYSDYLVVYAEVSDCGSDVNGIRSVHTRNHSAVVDIGIYAECGMCSEVEHELFLVPVDKGRLENVFSIEYEYFVENEVADCESILLN